MPLALSRAPFKQPVRMYRSNPAPPPHDPHPSSFPEADYSFFSHPIRSYIDRRENNFLDQTQNWPAHLKEDTPCDQELDLVRKDAAAHMIYQGQHIFLINRKVTSLSTETIVSLVQVCSFRSSERCSFFTKKIFFLAQTEFPLDQEQNHAVFLIERQSSVLINTKIFRLDQEKHVRDTHLPPSDGPWPTHSGYGQICSDGLDP